MLMLPFASISDDDIFPWTHCIVIFCAANVSLAHIKYAVSGWCLFSSHIVSTWHCIHIFWHKGKYHSQDIISYVCEIYTLLCLFHPMNGILRNCIYTANSCSFMHFYPRPVLAFGYCRCLRLSVCVSVRPCVNHELVRAITCHPFKLESPNLDHKCKTPWLRSLLFLGLIDLELQGQIKPKSNKLPHFELLRAIIHHLSQLGFPNLDQNCTLALLRSLLILVFIDIVF